ncbi:alpha-amylase Aah2 [Schizosaccharomyces octosporus yFS286]|uniref:Alpha-amylase Aah2 n=1 Tax=Schizosaccharomyces octosporus (strain yFS286) TaxID=483514 RepID=S9QWT3_SCHOY|nr:alpha-amylase Aah2 [Schizosaccharomyces octosporus yFS286]EPX70780.1 alpha-amylase Aah2 [Schizosaccharomyces octosporus yFS286]
MDILLIKISILCFLSFSLFQLSQAGHSVDEWKERSIYQIITDRFSLSKDAHERLPCDPARFMYCGGTWNGIRDHLDYIQDMGFDAIWISPIFENEEGNKIDGWSYHGYWTKNLYALNHHYGTKEDFKNLVEELHRRDMWILLDVAINSIALNGPLENITFDKVVPFNDESYYHPFCWVDYELNDVEVVQNCWLGDENLVLADLDTENPTVVEILQKWLRDVVEEYDIDGIRFDATKHAPVEFWSKMAEAAGVFTIGEYFTGSPTEACDYQNAGLDSFLNFPLYWPITWAFNNTGLQCEALATVINQIHSQCRDVNALGTFIGNHDVPRIAHNNTDQARVMNAISFVMMWDGIPIIYYGTEQNFNTFHDPFNREALWLSKFDTSNIYYRLIGALNRFRKSVQKKDPEYVNTQSIILKVQLHYMVIQKHKVISVLGNWGIHSQEGLTISFIPVGAHPGDVYFDIISDKTYKVDEQGKLNVEIFFGFPVIMYPKTQGEIQVPEFTPTLLPETTFIPSITITTHYVQPTYDVPFGYDMRDHPGGQQFWKSIVSQKSSSTENTLAPGKALPIILSFFTLLLPIFVLA